MAPMTASAFNALLDADVPPPFTKQEARNYQLSKGESDAAFAQGTQCTKGRAIDIHAAIKDILKVTNLWAMPNGQKSKGEREQVLLAVGDWAVRQTGADANTNGVFSAWLTHGPKQFVSKINTQISTQMSKKGPQPEKIWYPSGRNNLGKSTNLAEYTLTLRPLPGHPELTTLEIPLRGTLREDHRDRLQKNLDDVLDLEFNVDEIIQSLANDCGFDENRHSIWYDTPLSPMVSDAPWPVFVYYGPRDGTGALEPTNERFKVALFNNAGAGKGRIEFFFGPCDWPGPRTVDGLDIDTEHLSDIQDYARAALRREDKAECTTLPLPQL